VCCMATTRACTSGTVRVGAGPDGVLDNTRASTSPARGLWAGCRLRCWNEDVRGFLKNNAAIHLQELHATAPLRRDQHVACDEIRPAGEFCSELTAAVRAENPRGLQNAEYWPSEYACPRRGSWRRMSM